MKATFMAVTADKYELPVYIEDRLKDLSAKLGRKYNSVASCLSRQCACRSSDGERFLIVRVDEIEVTEC